MTKRSRSRKTGRYIRSRHRNEKWSRYGRVKVRRNTKGRFVAWHKTRHYTKGKTVKRKWATQARRTKWTHRARAPSIFSKKVILRGKWKGETKQIEKTEKGYVLKNWVIEQMGKARHGEGWDARPQVISG